MGVKQYITMTMFVFIFSILLFACGAKPPFEISLTLTSTLPPTLTSTSTLRATLTPTSTLIPTITPTPMGGGQGKIVFVSARDGNTEIYVMNSDGSGQTRLTNNPGGDNYPDWSPDGKKIIYRSERKDTTEVFVINADGTQETNLTQNPDHVGLDEPKWSPDGKKIAYVNCLQFERCNIFIMNADGSEKKPITNNEYDNQYFEWSPDSSHIVFWSYRNKQGDIYTINIDGTDELKLTNNPKYPNHISYNINPSWSPDGDKIIYMSTNFMSPHYEIYAIHPDGSDETRITQTQSSEWAIAGRQTWSPDGKKIVFMYWYPHDDYVISERICIMNSDGSKRQYITDGPSDDYPRWSPDAKRIAFISSRDGQSEIYVMNADGSHQTRITYSTVDEPYLYQFQWSP